MTKSRGLKVSNGVARDHIANVLAAETDECVIWPYGRDGNGYGRLTLRDGLSQFVHRRICELKYGPPPTAQHQAAHNCGKGHEGCVNWRHLRWATRKENEADKELHGTRRYGELHQAAKLTSADVAFIRMSSESQAALSRKLGVSHSTISLIKSGKRWAS